MASALRSRPGNAAAYIRSARATSTRLIPVSTELTSPAGRPRRCTAHGSCKRAAPGRGGREVLREGRRFRLLDDQFEGRRRVHVDDQRCPRTSDRISVVEVLELTRGRVRKSTAPAEARRTCPASRGRSPRRSGRPCFGRSCGSWKTPRGGARADEGRLPEAGNGGTRPGERFRLSERELSDGGLKFLLQVQALLGDR